MFCWLFFYSAYLDKNIFSAAVDTRYQTSGAFLQPNPVTLRRGRNKVVRPRTAQPKLSGEAHLEHGDVGAVRGGGQVAAPRHRVVRRLHIQLAFQDAFII